MTHFGRPQADKQRRVRSQRAGVEPHHRRPGNRAAVAFLSSLAVAATPAAAETGGVGVPHEQATPPASLLAAWGLPPWAIGAMIAGVGVALVVFVALLAWRYADPRRRHLSRSQWESAQSKRGLVRWRRR